VNPQDKNPSDAPSREAALKLRKLELEVAEAELTTEKARVELENAKRELDSLNHQVVGFIKRRPVTSLVIALTAGFVIGRIASR